jgi:hypothetical protein
MIEADLSIANPDHTWWHVVGDLRLCGGAAPLVRSLGLSRHEFGAGVRTPADARQLSNGEEIKIYNERGEFGAAT